MSRTNQTAAFLGMGLLLALTAARGAGACDSFEYTVAAGLRLRIDVVGSQDLCALLIHGGKILAARGQFMDGAGNKLGASEGCLERADVKPHLGGPEHDQGSVSLRFILPGGDPLRVRLHARTRLLLQKTDWSAELERLGAEGQVLEACTDASEPIGDFAPLTQELAALAGGAIPGCAP
jgi:hypothetical protein